MRDTAGALSLPSTDKGIYLTFIALSSKLVSLVQSAVLIDKFRSITNLLVAVNISSYSSDTLR